MRRSGHTLLRALLILIGAAGCETVCDEAADQLRECLTGWDESQVHIPQVQQDIASLEDDCNRINECMAECVVERSCEQLGDDDPANTLSFCRGTATACN